jgi:hypothetical protein
MMQGVSDMLASQGVKKAQADRALASLAEEGKILVKEFGKTKIYFPSQNGMPVLAPEVRLLCFCLWHSSRMKIRRCIHLYTAFEL